MSSLIGLDSRTPQQAANWWDEPSVRGTGTATDHAPTDARRSPRDRPRYGDGRAQARDELRPRGVL